MVQQNTWPRGNIGCALILGSEKVFVFFFSLKLKSWKFTIQNNNQGCLDHENRGLFSIQPSQSLYSIAQYRSSFNIY